MKKIKIIFSVFVLCLLASCKTGVYTTTGGKDDVAYLYFTSSDVYANKKVTVELGENTTFMVKVVKNKKARANYKGKLYAIQPGQKKLVVKNSKTGQVIYRKHIIVSTQETKEIKLP